MAYGYMVVVLVLHLVALPLLVRATDHVVGGDRGWTIDVDYSAWAKDRQFFVGDTLVFNYLKGDHNVAKVDEAGFNSCTVSASAKVVGTGKDVVMLSTAGDKWYVCGMPSHCSVGNQKLAITVLSHSAGPTTMPTQYVAPPPPSSMGNREGRGGSYVVMVVLVAIALLAIV